MGSKVGEDLVDGMNALAILLPGTSVTYYGEEIGMVNNYAITYEQGMDPQGCNYPPDQFYFRSRDFERTPFQWDDSVNAGTFSDLTVQSPKRISRPFFVLGFNTGAEPWLPVHDNYKELNLEAQKGKPYSHHTIYRDLREADKWPAVRSGSSLVEVVGKGTLGVLR